jgi:hypothetical protein
MLQNGIEVPTDLVTGKPRTDLLFLKSPSSLNTDSICHLLTRIDSGYFANGLCLNGTNHFLCVDFLGMDKTENRNKPTAVRARHFTHLGFCFLMFLVIVFFLSTTAL